MSLELLGPCLISEHIGGRGYGQIKISGKWIAAHRLVYELAKGPIPGNQVVRHRCDNRACVNPFHLELGTNQDNSDDMVQRGRQAYGERHGSAKLTEEDIVEIRRLRSVGGKLLAIGKRFGVSESLVSLICKRKSWSHVP